METIIFLVKLYVIGIPGIAFILSLAVHNDKFLKVLLEDQQEKLNKVTKDEFSEEEQLLLNMTNFKLEEHIDLLILNISFSSWLSLLYIIKIFLKSRKI